MNKLAIRITTYFAAVIWPCVMLTSDVVVAIQELTPQTFSSKNIDLNICDWSQPMCSEDSFINSGLDSIKNLHKLKCVRDIDMDGNLKGYDACNPQHRSSQWYQDKCQKNGFVDYGKNCVDLLKDGGKSRDELSAENETLRKHQQKLYVAIGLLAAVTVGLICLCVWLAWRCCPKKPVNKAPGMESSSDGEDTENTSLSTAV